MGHKLKFVLSDLHIGAGYAGEGGNPLEDFRSGEAFVEFLHSIWHESEDKQCEIELIINGDLFEFLQVPAADEYHPLETFSKEAYFDSCEKASVQRLDIIAKGHPDIFNALSDFMHVEYPQRRITIIKGNHDVHLFWPGVKKRLREILGASGTRASLLRFANEFVSREKIYIEHGHQRAETINGYPDSYDPRAPNEPGQIYYPVGSRFVIDFINEVESEWWFVDNIKPVTSLIWYALSQNFHLAAKGLSCFVDHAMTLGIFDRNEDAALLANEMLQNLEDFENRQEMAQRYGEDEVFRVEFHRQIQQIFLAVTPEDADLLPPAVSADPAKMGRVCQMRQQTLLREAAQQIAGREGARVILFGHTHHPLQETLPNGSVYMNTGSWVENFFDMPLETWETLFEGMHRPGNAAACLPYARIDYDEHNNPSAQLLYFNKTTQSDVYAAEEITETQTDTSPKGFFEKNFHWLTRLLRAGSS